MPFDRSGCALNSRECDGTFHHPAAPTQQRGSLVASPVPIGLDARKSLMGGRHLLDEPDRRLPLGTPLPDFWFEHGRSLTKVSAGVVAH